MRLTPASTSRHFGSHSNPTPGWAPPDIPSPPSWPAKLPAVPAPRLRISTRSSASSHQDELTRRIQEMRAKAAKKAKVVETKKKETAA